MKKENKRQTQSRLTRSARKASARTLAHYPRHKQPYTATEDKLLLKLFGATERAADEESAAYAIAERVGRTPMAVRKRVEILRVARRYGGKP